MVSVYALCQFIDVVLCQFIYAIYYCLEYNDSGQRRMYVRVDFDFFLFEKMACIQYTGVSVYTGMSVYRPFMFEYQFCCC